MILIFPVNQLPIKQMSVVLTALDNLLKIFFFMLMAVNCSVFCNNLFCRRASCLHRDIYKKGN